MDENSYLTMLDKDFLYFAQDGNWGNADELILIEKESLSDEDMNEIKTSSNPYRSAKDITENKLGYKQILL